MVSTNHLKKVVHVAPQLKHTQAIPSLRVDQIRQKEVNPDSNVRVVQIGKKSAAPFYLRIVKELFSEVKVERICLEATSVDSNQKAMRVANSLVRWGYGSIIKLSMKKSSTLLMVHVERAPTFKQSFDLFAEEKTHCLKERREQKMKTKLEKPTEQDP